MSIMQGIELDPEKIRDISPDVLDGDGRLRVLPAEYWASTTVEERAAFGHRRAIYGFPTVELVDYLRELIGDRRAIEIGSGHGVLAEALGIPATDNRMQEQPTYRARLQGQPPVRYGPNVELLDAHKAVRRYRPDVVVACWVTHRWDPKRFWAEGNEIGVREEEIISECEYIFVGNTHVHRHKSIWSLPHRLEHPGFVYSRAHNGTPEFVAVWS